MLTPPSIVAAIKAGYRPLAHPTALACPTALGGQDEKSGVADRTDSLRPLGSSQSS